MEAPPDFTLYVGSVGLAVLVPELIRRFVARGDKATEDHAQTTAKIDAEFRAEVRNDLKRLLEGQATASTDVAVLQQKHAELGGRLEALEERQREQARVHLEAVREIGKRPRR